MLALELAGMSEAALRPSGFVPCQLQAGSTAIWIFNLYFRITVKKERLLKDLLLLSFLLAWASFSELGVSMKILLCPDGFYQHSPCCVFVNYR